jgi:hypothetical protein
MVGPACILMIGERLRFRLRLPGMCDRPAIQRQVALAQAGTGECHSDAGGSGHHRNVPSQ